MTKPKDELDFKVFNNAEYLTAPLKWYEIIALWFCRERMVIDGDFICRFKILNGKHYILYCGKEQ